MNQQQSPINCPICGGVSNKLVGVSELFKSPTGHRPTTILGPGKFIAADVDIPLSCDGPVAMLRFHCLMGHHWGMTMREDKKRVYCVLHSFPDWEHEPTPEQLQKLVNDVEKVSAKTQYKTIESSMTEDLAKKKKKKKDS